MKRPTIQELILDMDMPFSKKWIVETFTEVYGVYVIQNIFEECMDILYEQNKNATYYLNEYDYFLVNLIKSIPEMVSLIYKISQDIEVPLGRRQAAIKLLADMDREMKEPVTKRKYKKRKK